MLDIRKYLELFGILTYFIIKHTMVRLLKSLIALIAIAPLGIMGQCGRYGSKCPKEAPCCNGGWCSKDLNACAAGCDSTNSYNSSSSCLPAGPFCVNLEDRFQDSSKLVEKSKWDGDPNKAYWTSDFEPNHAKIDNGHLILSMNLDKSKLPEGKVQGFGATVSSTRLMLYGNVSASIKSGSSSVGVVSSFITKNDAGDEIDYEWTDKASQVQTNYYWNGQPDYTHSTTEELNNDLSSGYHHYEIQWMPEAINWVVDGVVRRTVTKQSTFNASDNSYRFPARPSRIQLSIWDAAQINSPWTDGWSGGRIDWTDPNRSFNMEFEYIKISCLDPAKDTSWPPAGYGPQLIDSTQSKAQGNQSTSSPNNQNGNVADRPSSNSSIVVPIALAGGIFGGMVIIGYVMSAIARKKKTSKLSPGVGKIEGATNKTEMMENP